MDNPVAVSLEYGPGLALRFWMEASSAIFRPACIGREFPTHGSETTRRSGQNTMIQCRLRPEFAINLIFIGNAAFDQRVAGTLNNRRPSLLYRLDAL
jgi:hypothetical protein